jgi:ABC-2 type transport system permease protein
VTSRATTSARPPLGLTFASLLRADLTVLIRSVRTLIFNIALPLVVLVTTGSQHSDSGASSAAIIGIAITFGLISSDVLGYSITAGQDRENGVFQRLRVAPSPTWAIMVSRLTVQVVVNLIVAGIVVVIGSSMLGRTVSAAQWLLLIPVTIGSGAVFLSIGQALVGLIKSAALINAVGRVVTIGFILIRLPGTGLLGPAFKNVTLWTPAGATGDMFHHVLSASAWTGTDTNAVLACLGYIAVFGFLGIRYFRWSTR